MILTDKEKMTIEDLQIQEKSCMTKYKKYAKEAHDPVLRDLFEKLAKKEQQHHESLAQVLSGTMVSTDCNCHIGEEYNPKATYDSAMNMQEKQEDAFLATDSIGSEKLASASYNSNVFNISESSVRKLLEDIQIEEQNHAEMLNKYKKANGMN